MIKLKGKNILGLDEDLSGRDWEDPEIIQESILQRLTTFINLYHLDPSDYQKGGKVLEYIYYNETTDIFNGIELDPNDYIEEKGDNMYIHYVENMQKLGLTIYQSI